MQEAAEIGKLWWGDIYTESAGNRIWGALFATKDVVLSWLESVAETLFETDLYGEIRSFKKRRRFWNREK